MHVNNCFHYLQHVYFRVVGVHVNNSFYFLQHVNKCDVDFFTRFKM